MIESELQELMLVVAEKNGISVEKLKEEIQKMIIDAYKNPTKTALSVPRKDAIPTVNEIIQYLQSNIECRS